MVEQHVPSKGELLEALRMNKQEAVAKLRALPPEAFEQGRYENGWNGRQILAHIASIEWTYPRLLDIARQSLAVAQGNQATDERRAETAESGGLPTRTAQGGIDAYNERQVAKRAGASVEELLEEFRRNRAATIAAVEQADEDLLAVPIRSAGGIPGPVGLVIEQVVVGHVRAHVRDIADDM